MEYMYIRVSTVEQNIDRQLVTAQELNIAEDNIFIDKCSGKDTERPELKRLLSTIQPGDTVYCHELSRLGRNLQDLIKLADTIVKEKECKLVFKAENLILSPDENNLMTTLLFQFFGAIAEFERKQTLVRQREGIQVAREQGRMNGRRANEFNKTIVECACDKYINKQISLKQACEMITYTTKKGVTKNISIPTFYRLLDEFCEANNISKARYSFYKYK